MSRASAFAEVPPAARPGHSIDTGRRYAGQRQMAHHQLAHRHERKTQGSFRRCPGAGRRRTTTADQGQGPTTSAPRRGLAHRRTCRERRNTSANWLLSNAFDLRWRAGTLRLRLAARIVARRAKRNRASIARLPATSRQCLWALLRVPMRELQGVADPFPRSCRKAATNRILRGCVAQQGTRNPIERGPAKQRFGHSDKFRRCAGRAHRSPMLHRAIRKGLI